MNPLSRLDIYINEYTNTEKLIYAWIMENPGDLARYPIETIAEKTKTSKAAIIRFSKKIGYSGFAEFKFELSRYLVSGERDQNNDDEQMNTIASITSIYEGFIKQINNTIDLNKVKELVVAMLDTKRIKIIGNNRTGLSAMQLRYRLSKIGVDAEAVTDMVLVQVLENILKKGDLVVLFSTYGNYTPYADFAKTVTENGADVYLITVNEKNKISKYCKQTFVLPCVSKATTHSFLDDQAILFIFIEIILAEIGYKLKD
ncbi:MAG: MurR/RpiR family transcriptional regulator [Erysipelotrichaceae bacterium]|nr:MurR/RpiR family transcriptional regulator [Erysipelotrichaceae bacterium]